MHTLKKGVLGLLFGWMAIIGGAVGMGILRMPHDMAKAVPDPLLYFGLWLAGAIFVLVSIPTISELASMFGRSGGYYVFTKHTFGRYPGFVVGYMDWLTWCGGIALVSLVCGQELCKLVPALAGHEKGCAVCIWILFAALNWFGVRWGSRAQIATSAVKALGLLAIVALLFAFGHPSSAAATSNGAVGLAGLVLAFQAVIFAFAGWEAPIYMGEEIENPGRTIPRAALIGALSVIALYLLVNIALLGMLPISALAEESLPVGAAVGSILGDTGATVITVLAILIMCGTINSGMLVAPRVLYALGRDGLFSSSATKVNEGGTPTAALVVSGALTIALLLTGTFEMLLLVLGQFYVITVTITNLALFVLRRREPDRERPYRAFGYPIVPALALLMSVGFLAAAAYAEPLGSLYTLGAIVASYPIYRIVGWLGAKRS